MDKDRESGNFTDDARSDAHSPEPPPTQQEDGYESGVSSGHRGFTVQTGGRNAMAGTAERIGRAAGTAERQMRRSLELVRPASGGSGHSHAMPKERGEMAAHSAGDEAAHTFGELSELTAGQVQRLCEQLQDGVARSRRAARRLVSEHPVKTLAALAGFCFALGVGLSVGGSRHR
ncbi:MAG: hypothetical protein WA532_06185 [Candidatus Korobacteraceae bacterium]